MKTILKICRFKPLVSFISILFFSLGASAANRSPEGYWLSYHPDHKHYVAVIRILKFRQRLVGELLRIIPLNQTVEALCSSCLALKKSEALVGPIMMFNYQQKNHDWEKGKIIDSTTAKIYNSSLRVSRSGKKLYLTVYYGIGFRRATWHRISKNQIFQIIPHR